MSVQSLLHKRTTTGTITAGNLGAITGFSTSLSIGSISPSGIDINGYAIESIYDTTVGDLFYIIVTGAAPQSLFASVSFNGFFSRSADAATFTVGGGVTQWRFTGPFGIVNGNTYTFVIE